jgi:hypothetical protein
VIHKIPHHADNRDIACARAKVLQRHGRDSWQQSRVYLPPDLLLIREIAFDERLIHNRNRLTRGSVGCCKIAAALQRKAPSPQIPRIHGRESVTGTSSARETGRPGMVNICRQPIVGGYPVVMLASSTPGRARTRAGCIPTYRG